MKKIKSIGLVMLIVIANTSFAQLKRANKYYDNYEYAKAIQLYKKAVKKSDNKEALEKIANSYRLTKNYKESEKYYALLMKQSNVAPINSFYYGMVLKNNGKIDEAKEQFKIYANASPNDKKADLSVKSCEDIKIWISRVQQFEVSSIENLNSEHADFSPVMYKNELVFVSERTKDLVNYSSYAWNKQPFLNVYSSAIATGTDGKPKYSKKVKSFSWLINTNYHDGPVCFNTEQNTMFLTRVNYVLNKKDKNFVNLPKLYISKASGSSWSKAVPFEHNVDGYTTAHPSISADGEWLYFVSDMPGGYGGTDIYVSKKSGESWAKPVNLGPQINTAGSEVFPFIRKDGTLYFSSDGHSSFGGLDVFSVSKVDGKYTEVKNLGLPLNSTTDDFGIFFTDESKGYFSSDRAGGKGSDDIYSFVALNKFLSVAGKILFSKNINDPAKNAEVMLLTDDGKIINVATTDKTGFFRFDKLDPDRRYMVKLDESDPRFKDKEKYYLTDEKDKIIRVTVINEKGGKFVFQNLPADPNGLPELGAGDDVTIAGNLLYGENPSMPFANTKVNLLNDKGEIVQSTTTNAFGAFVFTDLPADQNFLVKVDENDTKLAPNTKIIITNKSGKELQTTKSGETGDFKFSFLAADKVTLKLMTVEDSELRFDLKGNLVSEAKAPLAGSTVNLINEKGEILQTTKTDANGSFQFTNLPADQTILFALDESDSKLKAFNKILLTNAKGLVVKEFVRTNGKFKFTILPADQNKLGVLYVDDPWLKVLLLKDQAKKDSLTIVENVYYNYGEAKILPEAAKTLDKVINIMKNNPMLVIEMSAHTDSRSTLEFNLKLSDQRAKAAVDYMLKGGLTKDRISGKGYGESMLINKCTDGVECTEEEHAKNRRTEFKILSKKK